MLVYALLRTTFRSKSKKVYQIGANPGTDFLSSGNPSGDLTRERRVLSSQSTVQVLKLPPLQQNLCQLDFHHHWQLDYPLAWANLNQFTWLLFETTPHPRWNAFLLFKEMLTRSGLDPNSLISSVLYREPAIPSYWCTVKAPSLSDFVSSGKTNASLGSTNPSQTNFAADSVVSDAEAFIFSQSSDSAPWFATGYDLKEKAFTCVLPQEDGHNHIHLLASSCLSTTLAGFLPSISILVAPSLVSDFAHFPEDRDERHELLYTNPMSSMIFPRALLQGPIVAFALLLRLIILLRACTLCAHTSSSCKPSFSFPSFSPLFVLNLWAHSGVGL